MKEKIDTIMIKMIAAITVLIILFSFLSQASGYMESGIIDPNLAWADLENTSPTIRYCELFITEGSSENSASTLSFTMGNLSQGCKHSVSGHPTGTHAWAKGYVYNGGHPNSGIGWQQTDPLR